MTDNLMEFLYPLAEVRKVTAELRRRNSDLQVLASVGGLGVPAETAEALVKSADKRAAFASSVARNFRIILKINRDHFS
jgi:GH18 family chitinase